MNIILRLAPARMFPAWTPVVLAEHSVRIEAELTTSHDDPKQRQTEIVTKQMTVVLPGSAESGTEKMTVSMLIPRFWPSRMAVIEAECWYCTPGLSHKGLWDAVSFLAGGSAVAGAHFLHVVESLPKWIWFL